MLPMKVRKEITLPSGATVIIRPPSMLDVMQIGEAPTSLTRREKSKDKRPLTQAEIDWHVRSSRALLLHCTGLIRWPDKSARLVEKPFDECREGEMTVEDLSAADVGAILEAVGQLREETAEAVQTFPEAQPPHTREHGCNGEAIPGAALQAAGLA